MPDVARVLCGATVRLDGAELTVGTDQSIGRPLDGVASRRLGVTWCQRRRFWAARSDAAWIELVAAGPETCLLTVHGPAVAAARLVEVAETLRRHAHALIAADRPRRDDAGTLSA